MQSRCLAPSVSSLRRTIRALVDKAFLDVRTKQQVRSPTLSPIDDINHVQCEVGEGVNCAMTLEQYVSEGWHGLKNMMRLFTSHVLSHKLLGCTVSTGSSHFCRKNFLFAEQYNYESLILRYFQMFRKYNLKLTCSHLRHVYCTKSLSNS